MNEFETAVVNEPSVFEPLKFHCTCSFRSIFILLREYPISKRFVDTGANRKSGPEVIKLFSCSTQLSMKFSPLINVKMPTVVGILTCMNGKNNILGSTEP